ncbi:hypothetical protein ACFSQ3_04560 [Sphingobacterium corticis]|uniref:DUF4935 domain-containing protein n=1 Tax=Sphingobacterium corticis TaxID=1812823 RepID=A0ABW5NGF7_9SPHI
MVALPVFGKATKQINEKFKFGDYPAFCKEYDGYNTLKEMLQQVESLHKELLTYSSSQIRNKNLQADLVIKELFLAAKVLDISADLYEKAKRRVVLGNPPGKNGSYGDAINWEIILYNSDLFDDLHIVANDKDYFSILDKQAINPFLELEYTEHTIGEITCYRSLTSFFKAKYPKLSLQVEQEKDEIISNLVNSQNFATTRRELERLKKYDMYSSQQASNLIVACLENSQISRILGDEDIKLQISEFVFKHSYLLDEETLTYYNQEWNERFPDDLYSPNPLEDHWPF